MGLRVNGEQYPAYAPLVGVSLVPGAYPYTTPDTSCKVAVDATAAVRTIYLKDGVTEIEQIIQDYYDQAALRTITVRLENPLKYLNGVLDGTVLITTAGALRGFARRTTGNWGGGV